VEFSQEWFCFYSFAVCSASIQLVYIGKNTRPITFITGSTSTAKLDVVAKEVFKSPVNPHIEGSGQGGDFITCDALYAGHLKFVKFKSLPYSSHCLGGG